MRKINQFCFLGMFFLCCTCCGCRKMEKEPVSITIIHAWGSTEADHVAMRDIYEGFQKENPDVRLHLIPMPTRAEMLRKVEDMIMVGDALDIVTFSGMGKNRTYEFMVENDMALDLMPYLEADPEFAKSISEANIDYWVTEENQLYTVADVLSLSGGYWYNEEIFEQAGIDSIPGTWNEFLDMCETLRGWSKEQGQGVCPLQASGEGYLYFADHILADRRKELAEMTQDGLMRQQGTELEEIAGRLKNIYRFSGSVIPDRQGYVLPEGIKGKRFPDPFFILFQPDGM
ncbi:MAG: carbohydrate ABC transporter substrate-binding protein [Ruminococcus sp.]|nr:carbohydrate ABC transporter substrate-binding protein [Ruminococcus sp.]